MTIRTDTIFQDQISEGFGGSNYHHLTMNVDEPLAVASDADYNTSWIAPRAVRIINNRMFGRVILGNAQANTVDVFRGLTGVAAADTDRAVITQFDPDTLVADTVFTPTLSTATADLHPHVVVLQYGYFTMLVVAADAATGPFDISYMAHYSFEDV